MPTSPAAPAVHSHTVSGARWLVLKSDYAHRCDVRLERATRHSAFVVRSAASSETLVDEPVILRTSHVIPNSTTPIASSTPAI